MAVARLTSQLALTSCGVGACIVSSDKRVVSVGYNKMLDADEFEDPQTSQEADYWPVYGGPHCE